MKKILIATLFALCINSCNYLDVVPDDTATLADAFKNENTAEGFVYSCYSYIPNFQDFREAVGWCTSNDIVGAYHWGSQWFKFLRCQQGEDNSSEPIYDYWANLYQGIRQCYMFLNNIEKVSPVSISQAEFDAAKKMWIGEVNFLIAYYHFLLFQHYGPIVIVKEEIPTSGEMSFPRSSADECVEEIAKMFDEAMKNLPSKIIMTSNLGRVTTVIAQAFKSRLYMYAASPLFNGNTDYANFKNKDGKILISQTADKNKWKKAMEETKKAIDMAHANSFELYKYTAEAIADPFNQAVASARYTMVEQWSKNKEMIWAYTGKKEEASWGNSFQRHAVPKGFRSDALPVGAIGATLTGAKIFLTKNGLPPESDPSFDWAGRMTIAAGDSTIKLHRDREPRFYAAIGFDRGTYEINGELATLKLKYKETHGCQNRGTDHLYSGYAIKKGIHPEVQATSGTFSVKPYAYPLMRLAELYLSYAEASAEFSGQLDADATTYINRVRSKAGIPSLSDSYGNISGKDLVKAIRRERMVEFVFEGHWYHDLRRWKEAMEWYKNDKDGMEGLNEIGATNDEYYKESKMEARKFLFTQKSYFLPITQNYININKHLVQNPGW